MYLPTQKVKTWPPVATLQELRHISGNLCQLIMVGKRASLLTSLKAHSSQGAAARAVGSRLLTHFDMVRRLGEDPLLMYLLLASTLQLPTPNRVIWPKPAADSLELACSCCQASSITLLLMSAPARQVALQ
jgi:hypothetical protein